MPPAAPTPHSPPGLMASLILVKSPGGLPSGRAYPLADAGTVLGRDDTCGIVIPNGSVSRRHAQVTRADGQFILEDLNSRNHTFLNNQPVAGPTPLRTDDRIKICDFLFRFFDDKAAPTGRPPGPPIPPPADAETDADPDDGFGADPTVQHTVARGAGVGLLDAQPAERLRVLLDISASLARTLEIDELLPRIADSLFGVFRQADRCFLLLTDAAGRAVPKVTKSRRPLPGGEEPRHSRTIVRKCLESLEAYSAEDASADASLGAAVSVAEFRIRSVMCVPLVSSDGAALGAIQIDTQDIARRFREDDLKLLLIVGNLAAVAVEKAQVHADLLTRQNQQKDIEFARDVQLGFLPRAVPDVAGYEFHSFYSAAQVIGGDYYDFVPMPGGRVAVVIGDVAGKGVPAALLMAKLSSEVRYCLLAQPDPAAAVRLLNDQIIRGGIGDRFVTLALSVLDPVGHTLTVVNAGHINPLWFRAADGVVEDIVSNDESGVPLGLVPAYPYVAKTVPVGPGEVFVVFTDGVTDATSPAGDMFGFDGVRAALIDDDSVLADFRPRAAGDRLVKAVRGHAAGRPQNDDIAVVCLGRVDSAGPPTSGPGSARPADPASASGRHRRPD